MCDVARTTSSAGASRSVRIVTALMTSSGPVQVSTDGRGNCPSVSCTWRGWGHKPRMRVSLVGISTPRGIACQWGVSQVTGVSSCLC